MSCNDFFNVLKLTQGECDMEENKKFFLGVILAFCIVLVGASCFWLGLQFADGNTKELDNSEQLEEKEPMSSGEIDELGKKLAEMTSYNANGRDYYFYMDSMSNENKLSVTIGLIPENEFILSEYAKSEYPDNCNGETGLTCYSRKISKNVFDNYYHKIFGLNDISYDTFSYVPSAEIISSKNGYKYLDTCKLEGSDIVCYNTFGGDTNYIYRYVKYDSSKLVDDQTLNVYTKFLGVERSLEENEVTNNGNAIYSDYNLKNIADHHNYSNWDSESPTKKDLFEKYGDKAGKYVLTFKKDADNNWYWLSTKLVK